MTPLVSVILPIYNAEKYLKRCFESILNQGLSATSYEVICINDGSTDDSLAIVEEWQERVPNLTILSQENQGIGESRNRGIDTSKGEWLLFLDPDDYLVEGSLKSLLDKQNFNDVQLIKFGRIVAKDDNVKVSIGEKSIKYNGPAYDFLTNYDLEPYCTNYLYRRSLLIDNCFRFRYRYMEDFPFITEVLLSNPTMLSINSNVYVYCINPFSVTKNRSSFFLERLILMHLDTFEDIVARIKALPNDIQRQRFIALIKRLLLRFSRRLFDCRFNFKFFLSVTRRLKSINLIPFLEDDSIAPRFKYVLNTIYMHPIVYLLAHPLYKVIGYKVMLNE